MSKGWHAFSVLRNHFIYDVYSGSLFNLSRTGQTEVDKYAGMPFADAVRQGLANSGGSALEFWREADNWLKQGYFAAPDQEPAFIPPGDGEEWKALCLHVSHDCDLRCAYCFAGKGDFGGERKLMDPGIGKTAVDLLISKSGRRRHVEIDFFGGEPMLNFPAVREIVAYGKKRAGEAGKILNFTLTTNALALNREAVEFVIDQEMGLVLSLDGRPEVHDRFRKTKNGEGSYKYVLPGIREAVELKQGKGYYVRGTFTAENLDFGNDLIHLAELGFTEISLEPAVTSPDEPYAIREEHLPRIFAEYERLVEIYLDYHKKGRPFNFFHFNLNLAHGPCLPRRLAGCGAGARYFAVTPDGELYPCHQFVGKDDFLMGNVQQGITNLALRRRMQQVDIYHKKSCPDCWARFLCSGGCHANAVSTNGNVLEPDATGCAMMKKRLECALGLQAMLMDLQS